MPDNRALVVYFVWVACLLFSRHFTSVTRSIQNAVSPTSRHTNPISDYRIICFSAFQPPTRTLTLRGDSVQVAVGQMIMTLIWKLPSISFATLSQGSSAIIKNVQIWKKSYSHLGFYEMTASIS